MDALKAQLLKIQEQLSALSASQKMLVTSLLAIMVMTVFWWSRYAGTAEMIAVLPQSLPLAEVGRIKAALDSHGIEARVDGDHVLVPVERRVEAVALLTYDDALPSAGANPWDEMTKQMGPFDPKSKTDAIQNHGKEMWLAQVIKSHFPGVANATVMIDPTNERRITGSLEPKASVLITTRGRDANTKRIAEAAAATVSYAVAGLLKKNVSVVINGSTQRMQDDNDSLASGELYDQIRMLEQANTDKIIHLMPSGTIVAVTVELETSSSQKSVESYDITKSITKEKSIKTSDTETQVPAAPASEAGAVSNVSLSLGGAAAQGSAPNTSNTSDTEFTTYPGKTVEQISRPAGRPTVSTAAVRLPRSYFVNKFKLANPTGKEPDENALQALFNQELPTIQDTVVKTVDLKSPQALAVSMFNDENVPMLASTKGDDTTGSSSGMSAMVGGHAKDIAVGALAVISLFMVSMIVKKGTPAPIVAAIKEVMETPTLGSSEMVAGIVGGEGGAMLDGMELGEDAVKAQQMVEQVSTMVKENPDAAANLIKRWLNRS